MGYYVCIAVGLPLVGVILLAVGWRRVAFAPFRIRPARMSVARLGLTVAPPDVERVNIILSSFAGGFNAMITSPTRSGWQRYCNSRPALYRPFAHEGVAMGYTLRRLFRCRPAEFEALIVNHRPQMRYLCYVGLGFWSGMRNHDPRRLARMVDQLDPLHGHLCYDGYGFKHGFFDYPRNPAVLRKFDALEGYAWNAAYQGVGRSFWFLFMGDHRLLIERLGALGEHARDAVGGLGLAAVFVYPDRLQVALELSTKLPTARHRFTICWLRASTIRRRSSMCTCWVGL